MDVILLKKVRNLGDLGDKVSVKPGYGRNYLIPYGHAVAATKSNVAEFEARREELERQANALLEDAKKRMEKLMDLSLDIAARASDEGKLYGSIGTREIAKAISDTGNDVQKSEVVLPEGALHYLGEYEVALQLHADVTATVKVNVIAEA